MAALVLLLATGCRQAPPRAGIISVALATTPNNLDPRYGTDESSARAQALIFNDLLTLDDNMNVAPGLASSWDTEDYRTYVVHLRQGVHFHDGHELTSKDVVYTFTSILDPNMASPYRGAYRDLASISALDPYTVQFVVKQPTGAFLVNLVMKIVPDGAGRELRDRAVPVRQLRGRRPSGGEGVSRLLRGPAEQCRHRAEDRARRHHARP